MFLERSISLQQKQALNVSSNLIQSLCILQLRHDELHAFLKEQAERNPLIEISLPLVDAPGPARADTFTAPLPRQAEAGERRSPKQSLPHSSSSMSMTGRGSYQVGQAAADYDPFQHIAGAAMTLREYMHEQITLSFHDATERRIAFGIADSLDPDGYLRTDTEWLAEILNTDEPRLLAVLDQVQKLEPAGVGARNLRECLCLQLANDGRLCESLEKILSNIELLARYDIARLATVTGTSQAEVLQMIKIIRSLDPKPGSRFDHEPVFPALPDVHVHCSADDKIAVELNTQLFPRVLIDRQYYSEISTRKGSEHEKRFVIDCMNDATFLVKCLDQRAATLLKVATEIASQQAAFFRHGPEHLKPLMMKDIAKATGYHESTVCRSIANKFMMTAHGMFEMKYFFSTAIAGTEGSQDHSAETVRQKIRQLVECESPETVLRDDDLVGELEKSGIKVARRTVAKYREAMRIPSSLHRRREKQTQQQLAHA